MSSTPKGNSPKGGGEMHFIVSTRPEDINSSTRKLIRSHVMLGKNRGKTRAAGQGAPRSTRERDTPATTTFRVLARSNRKFATSKDEHHADEDNPVPPAPAAVDALAPTRPDSVPSRVGSDYSLIRFAGSIDPEIASVVVRLSSIMRQTLLPHALGMYFDNIETYKEMIGFLTFDTIYLNAMICASQDYFDMLTKRGIALQSYAAPSIRASPHFIKALSLLRQRLAVEDEETKFSKMTICTIMTLGAHAYFMGEYTTARHHLTGLRKIITLRGGLVTLRDAEKQLVEVIRCDLILALHHGSKPLFFADPTLEPLFPYPDDALPNTTTSHGTSPNTKWQRDDTALADMDDDLARAWDVMSRFFSLLDRADETHTSLPKEIVMNTMASVTYRLLAMEFPPGSPDAAVRLGLLAFCSVSFLQWRNTNVHPVGAWLPAAYKECLLESIALRDSAPTLWLWLLMTGAVSVWDEPGYLKWLGPMLRMSFVDCELETWEELRAVLGGLLWSSVIHDEAGEKAFQAFRSVGLRAPEEEGDGDGGLLADLPLR
ncbi:hypothetical protein B0T22DRAFT_460111 [Podospora appendiculata]|uniref:Transcription factor domain-containing protein n=1 Tax=Podospora appendiculata TaxID=314037 RepID=A0AAE0X9U4_9PEZI|nr:hypothetical protein B0T22DRAFT_460111 [Podospora appendiculata]